MSHLKPPQKNAFWIDLLKILLPLLVCGLLAVHANPAGFTSALQQVFAVADTQEDAAFSRALKDALVFQPWRVELLEQLGAVQIRQGDPAAAVQTYRQAELHGDLSLGGQLAYTGALAETGQTEAASEALNQAALRSGLNAAQRDQILQARRKMRDLSGAVNDLQRWASENHGDMTLLYRLAAYTAVSQPKDAILLMPPTSDLPQELQKEAAGLRSALAELPGEAPPVQQLAAVGQAFARADDWLLAEYAFSNAVQADPDYAEAWAFWGAALDHTGGEAWPAFERALSLNPDSTITNSLVSLYWRSRQQPERGLPYLYRNAGLEPRHAIWQIEIGNTLVEMGDPESALQHFVEATNIEPSNVQPWLALAGFSVSRNVSVESLGYYAAEQALLLEPEHLQAMDLMGSVMMTLGNYDLAERFYFRCLDKDPQYGLAYLHLGQLYLLKQDYPKSYQHLKKARELLGDSAGGRQAAELLSKYFSNP